MCCHEKFEIFGRSKTASIFFGFFSPLTPKGEVNPNPFAFDFQNRYIRDIFLRKSEIEFEDSQFDL